MIFEVLQISYLLIFKFNEYVCIYILTNYHIVNIGLSRKLTKFSLLYFLFFIDLECWKFEDNFFIRFLHTFMSYD